MFYVGEKDFTTEENLLQKSPESLAEENLLIKPGESLVQENLLHKSAKKIAENISVEDSVSTDAEFFNIPKQEIEEIKRLRRKYGHDEILNIYWIKTMERFNKTPLKDNKNKIDNVD
ncbi:hypothetical protein TNCT_729851 [Trichonephila clavata]|uniref:Uncharacterized protein n=1 Tax=Trichonephila clavata TaxID=2740835 RepID=A0A8X6H6S0_TRICU|nr:hypothetical protein TNCT_729851 [Trichonephila clavata]